MEWETELPDRIEAKIVCVADKLRGGKAGESINKWFKKAWDLYFSQFPDLGKKVKQKTFRFLEDLKNMGWDGTY